jgi:Tetratricopeptide repeat
MWQSASTISRGCFRPRTASPRPEPLVRRTLAINEKSYGQDHPKVAIRLSNLAQLLQATNRLAEAEPLVRRALAIFEASLGPDHPQAVTARDNLAALVAALAKGG